MEGTTLRKPMLLSLVLLTLTASRSFATPSVSLSWNSCTGPIDKSITAGTTADIYASVVGQSQVSKAYQLIVHVNNRLGPFPDAWRFDNTGCEGAARVAIHHLAPAAIATSCPSFVGTVPSIPISSF